MHASILTGVHAGRSVGLRSICCGSARAGASHYICQSQGASKRAIINRYKCAELIYIVCVCVCVCVGTTRDPADGGATAVNDSRKRLP